MNQGKPAYPIAYFIAGWLCLGISSVAKADSMAYMSTNWGATLELLINAQEGALHEPA